MMERTQQLHQLLLLLLFALSSYFIVGSSSKADYCIAEEREALLNFVTQSFTKPQLVLSHWKGEDCCSWNGVGCSNTTGHVIELEFNWARTIPYIWPAKDIINFFQGEAFPLTYALNATSLDSSLFLLKHLQYLDLTAIDFNHTRFPQSISTLTNLLYLDLSNTGLAGVIPSHFGNLTKLQHLDLKGNYDLIASNLLWMSSLYSLQYLDMSNVNLTFATYWLHEINILPNLSTLILSGCNLQTLPSLLPYSNLSSTIKTLHLSDNQFSTSTIPCWLSNMTNLEFLNMSNNSFHNITIPECIGKMRDLMELHLQNNHFMGQLPRSLGQLKNLLILDLSFNLLQGSLLDVNFFNLSQLNTLYLKSNLLQGSLPGLNSNVQYIDMSDNKFSMGIEWFLNQNINSLRELFLARNNFFAEIPDSICKLIDLKILDLSNNTLIGEIPKCLSNFESLMYISLANNNLQGLIPQWMGNLPQLNFLSLGNNNFQGEISFLNNSINLIGLDLGQNNLTGSIPSWIGDRLLLLTFLNLRSNKFSGTIPSQLLKLETLQILDLTYNNLTGSLPKGFGYLNIMTKLENLDNYHLFEFMEALSGIYASWMVHIKGMELEYSRTLSLVMLLDLSYNNFIGEIPSELTSLIGLQSLKLAGNKFTGHIPTNIGAMRSLESLDLSRNNFSGEIPSSILKLTTLSHFNLSYNQLSGEIPKGGQFDTFDNSSYYGNPDLCGRPLNKSCKDEDGSFVIYSDNDDDDDTFDLYLGMGLGFVVGLWGVVGMLLLKRSWAAAYFRFYHKITDNIYVFIVVRWNQCSRG